MNVAVTNKLEYSGYTSSSTVSMLSRSYALLFLHANLI
jgi:hypothetical protein